MVVVVEPVLTEEKLRELLAEGHEENVLDYKRTLNLDTRRDVVELAKDLAAIQSEPRGGYIVVGADDSGNVVAELSDDNVRLFDEATVRSKVMRYLSEPLDLRVAVHSLDSGMVVLIYVGPNPDGWSVFRADGTYVERQGRSATAFRIGDVFVRHGTASERWTQADVRRLLERAMASRKESWRVEVRDELAAVVATGHSAQQIAALPTEAVTWQLDACGFDALVTELMRRDDDIPLRRLLDRAPTEAGPLLNNTDDLGTLLDRIVSVAALGLNFERREWFERAVQSFVRIYNLGFDSHGTQRGNIDTARLWLMILERIYGLGGLAVRRQDWSAVRLLVDRKGGGSDFSHYPSWLRHGLTMASRARLMETEAQTGLLARANNVVREVAALRPDVDIENEEALNSLCQFDALAALVAIGTAGRVSASYYYTNFARYYTMRTEPAFERILTDEAMRQELFDGDDRLMAEAIEEISRNASTEAFFFNGWEGIQSPLVRDFIRANTA